MDGKLFAGKSFPQLDEIPSSNLLQARRQIKVKEKNAALTIESYYKRYREVSL